MRAAIVTFFVLSSLTLADDASREPTSDMLYTFLRAEAQKHFDARRKEVAALKTADDVKARQDKLRKAFLDALGDLPKTKSPLKGRVIAKKKCDGYTVERVIYESRPEHHVTANFYLPDGKGPFPGVLVPCGHSANGKAADAYQRVCILMAKNGLAVLCYDPIGQGERIQLLDAMGKPAIKGSTGEHTMVGIGALLIGRNTGAYRIYDGIRSIDYLASRSEVDPKKLGCTGNSGGGTLTAYLMALDERIAVAAPSCYITSLEKLFATLGPQDAEQNIPGQVAFGMEHVDYVTMRGPKPTLILTGTQDFFDIQGAWTTYREAKLLYGLLGHGERVDLFEYNDKHGFSKPRREAAMRWMRRWLLQKDDAPVEEAFAIQKDEELQCTRTGQVLDDFKGKSVFHLNVERLKELEGPRKAFLAGAKKEGLLKEVRRLIALPEKMPGAQPRVHDMARQVFETESGILVSVISPKEGASDPNNPLLLYLGTKPEKGEHVVELRGMGKSAPNPAAWDRGNQFGETKEAFLALHLNRPLLGQRVLDLLSVVESLSKKSGGVTLRASGPAGVVALHAAALDPRIQSVTLEGSLLSWTSVVETPISQGQLANVVPGVLGVYDLPDLARAVAPRPLTIRSPVDAAGKPVSKEVLERAFAEAQKVYAEQKASNKLTLVP